MVFIKRILSGEGAKTAPSILSGKRAEQSGIRAEPGGTERKPSGTGAARCRGAFRSNPLEFRSHFRSIKFASERCVRGFPLRGKPEVGLQRFHLVGRRKSCVFEEKGSRT